MATEVVSGSVTLDFAEQTVASTTGYHARVSVYVVGAGMHVAQGSLWRVYSVTGAIETLLAEGRMQSTGNEVILLGNGLAWTPGQGDHIALKVISPFGHATGPITAYVVGWDPDLQMSPEQSSVTGSIMLTVDEQEVCELNVAFSEVGIVADPNGDPLAVSSEWNIYAIVGSDLFQLARYALTTKNDKAIFPNVQAGADGFVLTAKSKLGNSAVSVSGGISGVATIVTGGGTPPVGDFWTIETAIPAASTNPLLEQAAATSDVATQGILMHAQDAFAGATGSSRDGGDLSFRSGANAVGGSPGALHFQNGSTTDSMTVDAQGIVSTPNAFSSPEYIVPNSNGGSLFPVIKSGTDAPADANNDGSLYLRTNSAYVGAYSKQGGTYLGLAQLDAAGILTFDPTTSPCGIVQPQSAAAGNGAEMVFQSQAAKTGSGGQGGLMRFRLGCDDPPTANPASPRYWVFEAATNVAGTTITTPFVFKWLPGEVANFFLGAGTNGSGSDVAGVEISSATIMSIATENGAEIHLNVNSAANPNADLALNVVETDAANENALKLTFTPHHATSGDVTGLQIDRAAAGSIGTGQLRYLDISDAGTRLFDVRPDAGASVAIVFDEAKTASTGAIRFGDIASIARNLIMGRTANNLADINILTTDGAQTLNLGDFNQLNTHMLGVHVQLITQSGAQILGLGSSGDLVLTGFNKGTTVGAVGGASALPALPLGYLYPVVDGVVVAVPYYTHP